MTGSMVCIAVFAIFMLFLYYERKERKRKEHDNWIYDCRQCLMGITRSFRRDCQSLAEEAFEKYTNIIQNSNYRSMPDYMTYSFLSDYRKSIDSLKEGYIENVTVKAKEAMWRYTFTSIPDYLIEEYSKQISNTYDTFYNFSYLMREQIEKAKENK